MSAREKFNVKVLLERFRAMETERDELRATLRTIERKQMDAGNQLENALAAERNERSRAEAAETKLAETEQHLRDANFEARNLTIRVHNLRLDLDETERRRGLEEAAKLALMRIHPGVRHVAGFPDGLELVTATAPE